jgi:hypothetical protein
MKAMAASCRVFRHLDRISDLSIGQPAAMWLSCGRNLASFWHWLTLSPWASCLLPWFVRKQTEMDLPAILRSLVLLVPVLYFMAMPDVMLGNQAFKKRFIGTNNGAIGRQAPSIPPSQGAGNDPDAASPTEEIEATRQGTPQERTILEIFLNAQSLQRSTGDVVTGMILRDEQLKPHFGGRDSALYRFLINLLRRGRIAPGDCAGCG